MKARLTTLAALGAGVVLGREALSRAREIDLSDRTVLVIGGSRGLGLLLAREFAREGGQVAICARDAEELERARRWLAEEGHHVVALPCDAGDEQQVKALVAQVEERLGEIEVLVNNAAIMQVGEVALMSADDFRGAHSSTFWAALLPTLAVLPGMRERREGRVVNITSIGGRVPGPHLAPYTSAKFAVVGLSEALRVELARDGIAVTTVVPWFMRTGSYLNAIFKEPAEAEFRWFALGAALPFIAVDAERAARRIVQAAKRGEADVAIGWPASVVMRFHGVFPGLTADMAALGNRLLLPRSGDPARAAEEPRPGVRGELLEARVSSLFDAITAAGRRAADRLNERRGPGPANELRAQEERLAASASAGMPADVQPVTERAAERAQRGEL